MLLYVGLFSVLSRHGKVEFSGNVSWEHGSLSNVGISRCAFDWKMAEWNTHISTNLYVFCWKRLSEVVPPLLCYGSFLFMLIAMKLPFMYPISVVVLTKPPSAQKCVGVCVFIVCTQAWFCDYLCWFFSLSCIGSFSLLAWHITLYCVFTFYCWILWVNVVRMLCMLWDPCLVVMLLPFGIYITFSYPKKYLIFIIFRCLTISLYIYIHPIQLSYKIVDMHHIQLS